MKTILISNRKGGTGKSTTAINLASYLAKENSSVLLIDFDTQGHSSIGVGQSNVEDSGSHSIFYGKTLSESFRPTVLENLTLSPALEFFEIEKASLGILKNRLESEQLSEFFDYCIIDTAPIYDFLLKNSLEVANSVIIPVIPHYLGIIGVKQMFRAIYQMSLSIDKKVPYIGILPVMFNPHIKEHQIVLAELKNIFGDEKLFSPIGVDINFSNQFRTQEPLILSKNRSKGAKDYENFTFRLKLKLQGVKD